MPEIIAKASTGSKADRPATQAAGAAREFAQQGAAATRDIYEKSKAAAEETNKTLNQTYSTVAKSTAEFNVQWIEMLRANTNSTFDFVRQLVGVKSPSEYLEVSAAHARKQFETLTEQGQHLAVLAQKVTSDAVQPLAVGVKSAFNKTA